MNAVPPPARLLLLAGLLAGCTAPAPKAFAAILGADSAMARCADSLRGLRSELCIQPAPGGTLLLTHDSLGRASVIRGWTATGYEITRRRDSIVQLLVTAFGPGAECQSMWQRWSDGQRQAWVKVRGPDYTSADSSDILWEVSLILPADSAAFAGLSCTPSVRSN